MKDGIREVKAELLPRIDAEVNRTPDKGTLYLTEPGVVLLSKPEVQLDGMLHFLQGFPEDLEFFNFLYDEDRYRLTSSELLAKTAGQLCYLSFGPGRTRDIDANIYLANILKSGHGSVLEHAYATFLFYGISRSLTHELVRHRAGFAFSQVSQRYVDGGKLRFVERPEFQQDPVLHEAFEQRIDRISVEYADVAAAMAAIQQERGIEFGMSQVDLRKARNQVARACLLNETEAPIITTANMRAWRHFLNMRASIHAETEIRELACRVHDILNKVAPLIFQDFRSQVLADGTRGLACRWPKV